MELGWLDQMPRIFGVQPEGSASVANAFFAGTEEIKPVKAETIADSVSVDHPHDGLRALRAATQTGGRYITVTDDHILKAIARLGLEGIFAEPARLPRLTPGWRTRSSRDSSNPATRCW